MENPEYPPIGELRGTGFSLALPRGWMDRSIYCASGPVLEGFQASLAVIVEHRPELKELKGYVDGQLQLLEGQLEGFALRERQAKAVGGRPTEFAHYAWTSPEGVPLRQSQWYVHQPPNVLVITASAHQDAFDQLEPVFLQAVEGIQGKTVAKPPEPEKGPTSLSGSGLRRLR